MTKKNGFVGSTSLLPVYRWQNRPRPACQWQTGCTLPARLLAAFVLLLANAAVLHAQLAITEVMSSSSTNRGSAFVASQSDFWELTNFGTNAIDLTGYTFYDRVSDTPEGRAPLLDPALPPLIIEPGQSVIFVRFDKTTNVAQFRAWWGDCLAPSVPVRMVRKDPGFDAANDGVRVWDAAGNLVDRVDFGLARRGVTFISDTNTGDFGAYSRLDVCGTCQGATADDIGSPGVACGPIPLQIEEEPTSQTACVGAQAMFSTRAIGLPRAKYQWFSNGVAIPGATAATFTITNVQISDRGTYHVVASNGLSLRQSAAAMLTVSTNPSPPTILSQPTDAEVYAGQSAVFQVTACAYPPAVYQWFSNGVSIAGATSPVLTLPNCTPAMSGAQFSLRAENSLGTSSTSARLIVTPKPELRITEVMASAATNCVPHADWFEITNLGTNTVNLRGYRFSDRATLVGAFVITQSVSLAPGQSAICVERLTASEFGQWWGEGNLPPSLAIVRYTGMGLSGEDGDALYLWNAAATDPGDSVTSTSFPIATTGISFRYDDGLCLFACGFAPGEFGSFRAVECDDVGSPGYTTNGPPRLVSIVRDTSGARVTWHAVEGKTYRVEYNATLQPGQWATLGEIVATNSLPTMNDLNRTATQRFYRVRQLTP